MLAIVQRNTQSIGGDYGFSVMFPNQCIVTVVLIAGLSIHQIIYFLRYSHLVTRPVDITRTIEYRVAKWVDRNMGGQRTFIAARAGTYTGQNAGSRDAAISIVWLKAFGVHAIYVPGPNSTIPSKPFNNSKKFDGLLPVLWYEDDDTIFAIPQRTRSLGHIVPADAIVRDPPIHGLDIAESSRYVAALDDPALPASDLV